MVRLVLYFPNREKSTTTKIQDGNYGLRRQIICRRHRFINAAGLGKTSATRFVKDAGSIPDFGIELQHKATRHHPHGLAALC